ncbi:hypothetical protein [Acidipropionibacterium acidipropionici]|uniref:hypothetical protein n=1 Tax=Acidipropionibacterium acidipropionici TaxID=1748 RepID=UPI0012B5FBD5|nr:hypothetical protein [Acidipropionibacterium acidipropionici]
MTTVTRMSATATGQVKQDHAAAAPRTAEWASEGVSWPGVTCQNRAATSTPNRHRVV